MCREPNVARRNGRLRHETVGVVAARAVDVRALPRPGAVGTSEAGGDIFGVDVGWRHVNDRQPLATAHKRVLIVRLQTRGADAVGGRRTRPVVLDDRIDQVLQQVIEARQRPDHCADLRGAHERSDSRRLLLNVALLQIDAPNQLDHVVQGNTATHAFDAKGLLRMRAAVDGEDRRRHGVPVVPMLRQMTL